MVDGPSLRLDPSLVSPTEPQDPRAASEIGAIFATDVWGIPLLTTSTPIAHCRCCLTHPAVSINQTSRSFADHLLKVDAASNASSGVRINRQPPVHVSSHSVCAVVLRRLDGGMAGFLTSPSIDSPPYPMVISHIPLVTWTVQPALQSRATMSDRLASVRAARLNPSTPNACVAAQPGSAGTGPGTANAPRANTARGPFPRSPDAAP